MRENSLLSESIKTEALGVTESPFEQLAGRVERVLCICARPGHEVLFAGASLHRLAARGSRVTVIALSTRSPTLPPPLRTRTLAVSSDGLRRAAEILSIARVEQLAMSSPPLAFGERIALQERLCQVIREERPDLVISEGLGVPAAAVDRQAGVALSDAAIAAAAAPAFGTRPSAATPPHEITQRWLFAPPTDVAIYRHRSEEADRTNHKTWITVEAGSDLGAKWSALRAYLPELPDAPTPALERILRTERFLAIRYVSPTVLVKSRRTTHAEARN